MRKYILFIVVITMIACSTATVKEKEDPFAQDNKKFLEEKSGTELFRVLITPDNYQVVQLNYQGRITRNNDESGDKYILEEVAQYNQIDEAREGIVTVWLFPDSGAIMKIRPTQLTFLVELDNLIVQDLQRWTFSFPEKTIEPTKFDVKYRIVLRKKLSDEEIMQQIREKIKDKTQ
ncbi:MAG: hypothetical protein GYA16_13555 [Spirochaetes bacterium]|nr:hypothetical protein [Spirochaetota bacterium]HOM09989.1 hypothetical protein [Spirochaetota bacterium]HPP49839.1 hypothetical protein [Spirochaetota bacterium]HXK64805.1 hypothetical protein [Spirochaetota bacterium]